MKEKNIHHSLKNVFKILFNDEIAVFCEKFFVF